MSFSLFSVAMLLICAFFIVLEVFKGYKVGFVKSLISLAASLASVILSILLSRVFSKLIALSVMTALRAGATDGTGLVGGSENVDALISFAIQVVGNIVMFVVVFFIINAIINLIFEWVIWFKTKDIKIQERSDDAKDKKRGAIVGMLCGIVIVTTVTSPIMGTLELVGDAVSVVDSIDEEVLEQLDFDTSGIDSIKKYSNDAVGSFFYCMGGDLIYPEIAVGDFNNKKVSIVTEVEYLRQGVVTVIEGLSMLSGGELSADNEIDADALRASLEKSEIMKVAAADIMSSFSSAWLRGEGYLEIYPPDFNDNIVPLVEELLVLCSKTDDENVYDNIVMLLDIVSVLAECDIGANTISEDIDYTLFLDKLYKLFDENEKISSAKEGLWNIATGVAIYQMNEKFHTKPIHRDILLNNVAKEYNRISADDSYMQKERVDALGEAIENCFETYNILLGEGASKLNAEIILTLGASYRGELDGSDIYEMLLRYADPSFTNTDIEDDGVYAD